MRFELGTSARVLVIDDSPTARTVMNTLLSNAGYKVFVIPSAIGATQLIYERSIDVVLIDLNMPGLSGERLIGLLRSNPKLQRLILIVVSGENEEELERVRTGGQVNAVLRKEDIGPPLLQALQRLLAGARGLRRLEL